MVMSEWRKYVAWCVTLLAVGTVLAASKDEPTDCDPNKYAPVLNNTSGSLKIKDPNKLAGKVCDWVIDGTNSDKTFLHLDLSEDLFLADSDELSILDDNDKNKTLYSSKGFLTAGVILIGSKYKKMRVRLNFTAEPVDKSLGIKYATNGTTIQIQDIASTGCLTLPHPNTIDLGIGKNDFTISLKSKSNLKKLLLSLGDIDLNGGTMNLDKVEKYTDKDAFTEKNKPELILSKEDQAIIKVNALNIDPKVWKGVKLHFELVDSFCSVYTPVTDLDNNTETINFNQPDPSKLASLSSYRCLNIFEHSDSTAKFLFDLRNFTFLNNGDLITILDGMSRDSANLAVIQAQSPYVDTYWRQLYLYSTANKIWITYDSPQVINKTPPKDNIFGVRPLSQGGRVSFNKTMNSTSLEITDKKKTPTPVVYVYTADPQKQILIDFDEKNTLPGSGPLIGISDSSMQTAQPFIKLNGGQYPPDIIASNGNELKVEIYQTLNIKANVRVENKGCYSSVIGSSGTSYSLTGCNDLCSWLIPKRDNSNGTFVLQFSQLNLNANTDELSMERLPSKTSVFKLKGPLMTTTFPNLILDANETYVMYTRRQCKSSDNTQVLAASLVYDDFDQTTQYINVAQGDDRVLKTSTYPNYFSIGLDHTFRVGKTNINDSLKALVTFTDFDLIAGHQLLSWPAGQSAPTPINATKLSDLSDLLVELPYLLNLTSQSIVSATPPFSARGFSANLKALSCGDSHAVEKDKPLKFGTPTSLANIKKCVWIVTTTDSSPTLSNLINVTIDQGKDKFDLKLLKFYDSNSVRDNKLMNFTYYVNDTFLLSSTNSLIIEYDVPDKNPPALNLTITQGVCTKMCWNTKRCLLPQFQCNGFNDCGDWSDESCNGTTPHPSPQPEPGPNITYRSGVNGWVVFLVICPLMIGVGVLGTLFGPQMLSRFGRGRYREFQDFSEVS